MRRKKLLLLLTVFVIATQSLFSVYASDETSSTSQNLNKEVGIAGELTREEYNNYMEAYNSLYQNVTAKYTSPVIPSRSEYVEYLNGLKNTSASITVSYYFSSVSWVKGEYGWTLSCAPKETLKSSHYRSANEFMMNVSRAYSLLEEKYSGNYRWGNSEAIFAQLHCHALFAPNKSSWNLDMWRTETDLDKLVKYKCNSPY